MCMRKVYLIRHGEKLKTSGDPSLSDVGRRQAEKTAKYIKNFPIKGLVCSPLFRTMQTAEFISNELGIGFDVSELLRERANWGDDPGQSLEDFLSMWLKSSKERKWQPPVGDSSYNAGERLMKVILDPKYREMDNLVFVTHGGIITDFLRNIFSTDYLDKFVSNFEDNFEDSVKECSITTIESKDENNDGFKIIEYASTNHLNEV